MFLIMGIGDQRKEIATTSRNYHSECDRWGEVQVFKISRSFRFFFIPVFSWNHRYVMHFTCCNQAMELSPEIGMRLEKDPGVDLFSLGLFGVSKEVPPTNHRSCARCQRALKEDFDYCPHCGTKII